MGHFFMDEWYILKNLTCCKLNNPVMALLRFIQLPNTRTLRDFICSNKDWILVLQHFEINKSFFETLFYESITYNLHLRPTLVVTVMLVTSWWWLTSDVGGRIIMLATLSLCWWFSQCIKSVTNIQKLSPTHLVCNIRHQHRCDLLSESATMMLMTWLW